MRCVLLAFLGGAALAGCGDDASRFNFTRPDAGEPATDVTAPDDVAAPDDGAVAPLDVGMIPIRDNGPVGTETAIVYAHTDTTLFSVDARTNRLTRVRDFAFPAGMTVGNMTDIAVDAEGNITGTTATTSRASGYVWRINPTTAACTRVVTLPGSENFVALSWVPRGVLNPNDETLVGGTMDGDLYRIDLSNGRATRLFSLRDGSGRVWPISGDFVAVANATYVTLRGSGTNASDVLGVVDFARQTVTVRSRPVGFDRIFGAGYWRQRIYGFTRAGAFIAIDQNTGVGTLVAMPTPTNAFSGAGVTTTVSIEAPL